MDPCSAMARARRPDDFLLSGTGWRSKSIVVSLQTHCWRCDVCREQEGSADLGTGSGWWCWRNPSQQHCPISLDPLCCEDKCSAKKSTAVTRSAPKLGNLGKCREICFFFFLSLLGSVGCAGEMRISRGEAIWDKVCVPAVGDKPGLILVGSKTFLAVRFWGGLALSWMNDSSAGPGGCGAGPEPHVQHLGQLPS